MAESKYKTLAKKARPWLGGALCIALLTFVIIQLQNEAYQGLFTRIDLFIYVTLLVPLIPFFKILSWYQLTKGLGIALPLSKTIQACYYSIAGRYIPGKIFFVVGRVTPYGPDKKNLLLATIGMLIEFILEFLAAFILLFFSLLIFGFQYSFNLELISFTTIVFVLCCLLATPKFLQTFLKLGLKLLKKESKVPKINAGTIFKTTTFILGHWFFYLICIKLISHTIFELEWSSMPYIGASVGLSAGTSTVALFSPGGLGLREFLSMEFFALVELLAREEGLLLASLCRILQWAGEILSFCIYFIITSICKSRASEP